MKPVTQYMSERTQKVFPTEAEARADENLLSVKAIKKLLKRITSGQPWVPEVGDVIYVPTSLYIDHGEDDVVGGMALVTEVKPDGRNLAISVAQHPGNAYYWGYLSSRQAELMERFRDQIAYPDPDVVHI